MHDTNLASCKYEGARKSSDCLVCWKRYNCLYCHGNCKRCIFIKTNPCAKHQQNIPIH